jgi:toxin CptA
LSIASSPCRIDWRPSRQLCAALLALGALAALSVALSDLPVVARWLFAPAVLAHGVWLARREWRRPALALEFEREALLMHTGARRLELSWARLRLRGPLACVDWRDADGRRGALSWSVDTLPAPMRRQLRLRLGGQSPA